MPEVLEYKKIDFTTYLYGVDKDFYPKVRENMEQFLDNSLSADEKTKATFIVSNHLYLIQEYLNLGRIREIDYTRIHSFAMKNKDLVRYLFKRLFIGYSIDVVNSWLEPSVDILECAMYRPSNRYNKHNFH